MMFQVRLFCGQEWITSAKRAGVALASISVASIMPFPFYTVKYVKVASQAKAYCIPVL